MLHTVRTTSAILALVIALCCRAVGQQSTGPVKSPPGPTGAVAGTSPQPRLEESRPPIFYLPDKQGNLQAVLEFPYEKFADLFRLRNDLQSRNALPEFNVDRTTVHGTAGLSFAELLVRVDLSLRSDRWIRVPLRMEKAVLRGQVVHKGPATQFVQYEEGVGYVCWIRGKPDSDHQISLRMLVPLEKAGRETRVAISLPRAAVSEMRLRIPETASVVALSDGASLVSQMQGKDGTTEFVMAGLNEGFHVSWQSPGGKENAAAIDVLGDIDVRFDGRAIVSQAKLTLRSFQGTLDRVLVRLPPNTELLPTETANYSVSPLSRERGKEERQTVEIRLRRGPANPLEFVLKCHREYRAEGDASNCELAGFDVIGAVWQSGTITISAPREWKVVWTQNAGLRQVEPVRGEGPTDEWLAAFEYYSVPHSLPVQFLPSRTAVSVEPEYTFSVDKKQIGLDGRLKCRISGTTVTQIELDAPGWRVDHIGPEDVVAVDRLVVDGNPVVIPFVRPMAGAVEVNLSAHQHHRPGASSFVALVPRVKKAATTNANLTVVVASNVEVTPNADTKDLLRRRPVVPQQGAPQQHEAWHYLCTGSRAIFAADFRVCPQQIAVDVTSQITVTGRHAAVEQRISYSISYEPLHRLVLAVPRLLAGENRVQFLCDGQPLCPGKVLGDAAERDEFAPLAVGVMLPEARIGSCDIVARYSVPVTEQALAGQESLHIPLIMPVDGRLAANNAIIRTERVGELASRSDVWTRDELSVSASNRSGMRLTSPKRTNVLTMDVVHEDSEGAPTIVVDRAWIQTGLASSHRQDRLVYQVETERENLEVLLPPGASARSVKVLVNGQIVRSRTVSKNKLLVPLARGSEKPRQPWVVEMVVPFSQTVPSSAAAGRIEFTQLAGRAWYRKVFWQLDLPVHEVLVSASGEWNGEYCWGWGQFFWEPLPALEQSQLEAWARATGTSGHSGPRNSYLFSAFGTVEPITVGTVRRTWIVIAASSLVLILALLLMQVRALRHPAILLMLGVGLLAGGLLYPVAALLLAQAAALGMLLALLAVLLHTWLRRRNEMRRGKTYGLVSGSDALEVFRADLTAGDSKEAAEHSEVSWSEVPDR